MDKTATIKITGAQQTRTSELTNKLRWKNGVLEQAMFTKIYEGSIYVQGILEWFPVPIADD